MLSHRDAVVARARAEGWTRGAEIGVGSGLLFARLLAECPDLCLIGVDAFYREDRRILVRAIADRFVPRCSLLEGDSREQAQHIADESLDFVFIDAGHSYHAVSADIDAWWPKVRRDGWFGGHDYHEDHPGVIRAVQERFGDNRGLVLEPFAIWSVRR